MYTERQHTHARKQGSKSEVAAARASRQEQESATMYRFMHRSDLSPFASLSLAHTCVSRMSADERGKPSEVASMADMEGERKMKQSEWKNERSARKEGNKSSSCCCWRGNWIACLSLLSCASDTIRRKQTHSHACRRKERETCTRMAVILSFFPNSSLDCWCK